MVRLGSGSLTLCMETELGRVTVSLGLELGQMVSILKYRDTIRYRYQTFKVSSVDWIVL